MYINLHGKYHYACHISMKIDFFFDTYSKKSSNNRFHEKSVHWWLSCSMQTDVQTDMMKLTATSHNFSNVPTNGSPLHML